MAASNVTITRKSDGASISVPAYKFFDAVKYSGRLRPEDDSIEIEGVRYIRSSMDWSAGGATIATGSYLPVFSNLSNVNASISTYSLYAAYTRINNRVIVSGAFIARANATGLAGFDMTLPIASNFANNWELGGTCSMNNPLEAVSGPIFALLGGKAHVQFYEPAGVPGNNYFSFMLQYEVI